jgi:hypothetical protein
MARGLIGFALAAGLVAAAVGFYFWSLPDTDVKPHRTGPAQSPSLFDAPSDALIVRTDETPPRPPIAAAGPAEVPDESGHGEQELVPLENLLRLPRAAEFPAIDPEASRKGDPLLEPREPTPLEPRLRIEGAMRRESTGLDRGQERDQIDVGASVKVDESTRIRGGVRIERDPNLDDTEEAETAPMIGVEKRF